MPREKKPYHDNIFVKRSAPTVCFAHRGITPFDKINKVNLSNMYNKLITSYKLTINVSKAPWS